MFLAFIQVQTVNELDNPRSKLNIIAQITTLTLKIKIKEEKKENKNNKNKNMYKDFSSLSSPLFLLSRFCIISNSFSVPYDLLFIVQSLLAAIQGRFCGLQWKPH